MTARANATSVDGNLPASSGTTATSSPATRCSSRSRTKCYKQSVDFAKLLGRELATAGLQYTPQHAEDIPTARLPLIDAELGVYRYDNLVVLKDVRVPAVLFEAGLIINRKEELVLNTPERRALLAKAITSAALAYCDGTPGATCPALQARGCETQRQAERLRPDP